jgi:hypothetical protein
MTIQYVEQVVLGFGRLGVLELGRGANGGMHACMT